MARLLCYLMLYIALLCELINAYRQNSRPLIRIPKNSISTDNSKKYKDSSSNVLDQMLTKQDSILTYAKTSLECSAKNIATTDEIESVGEINSYKNDLSSALVWVGSAIAFACGIAATKGVNSAVEFASGYVLEQSLSVDNLFVFLVLFDYFKVPKAYQERVLKYGLWGAGVLRAIFIGLGAVVLTQFHQVLLVFAGILLFSSYKILFQGGDEDEDEDISQNAVVKFAKNFFKTSDKFDENRFFTYEDGVKLATPLFLCLVCVEISDVLFALDSVPAVFGVTSDPFIVFTSNIFAIGSLRAVFGVLSKAVSQLEYLEKAVGIVLGFVAVKMATETFGYEIFSPLESLVVVLSILSTGIAASVWKNGQQAEPSA